MKKIFSILLLSMILGLFSSCIIVPEDRYTFTFYNDTQTYIYDWYLKNKYDINFTMSSDYCDVPPGYYSSMSDLREDEYQVYYCLLSNVKQDVYVCSEYFFRVNKDCTYYLSQDDCWAGGPRSAVTSANENIEPNYILMDSDGNKYPLKTVVINKQ